MSPQSSHFLNKVYYLFWLVSLILITIAFNYRQLPPPENTFSISVYDTFYVMEIFQFALFLGLFYFLLGFGYWLVKKVKGRLNTRLTYLHAIIMFGSLSAYGIFSLMKLPQADMVMAIGLIAILFIAQPLYVINLMIGIFNWRRDRKAAL